MPEPLACHILRVAYAPPLVGSWGVVGCLFRLDYAAQDPAAPCYTVHVCRSLVRAGTMLQIDLETPLVVLEAMAQVIAQAAAQRGPELPGQVESLRN